MFHRSMHGCALVTRDGGFIAANQAFCELTKYSELELTRRTFADITDPSDVKDDLDNAERVAEGKVASYEMLKSYVTKTKEIVPVLLRVDAIRKPDGTFICFYAQATSRGNAPMIGKVPDESLGAIQVLTKLRENWPVVLWILTGIAALVGYALKSGSGGK